MWGFLKGLEAELLYEPTVPFLVIYPKKIVCFNISSPVDHDTHYLRSTVVEHISLLITKIKLTKIFKGYKVTLNS